MAAEQDDRNERHHQHESKSNMYGCKDEKCMQRSGRKAKVTYGTVQEGSAPLKK